MTKRIGDGVRVGAVIASVLAAAASASAPARHNVQSSSTIESDYEATWSGVIDMFADRSVAIQTIDKSSGLIVTDWMALERTDAGRYADCGDTGLASALTTAVKFNVRVKDQGGSSSVTVNTTFRQERYFDRRNFFVDCTSRGTLEGDVHGWVERFSKASRPRSKPEARPVEKQRGYYCTSSTGNEAIGTCARDKGACTSAYTTLSAAVDDLTTCVLVERAWCVGDARCAPTAAACDAQRTKAGLEGECTEIE